MQLGTCVNLLSRPPYLLPGVSRPHGNIYRMLEPRVLVFNSGKMERPARAQVLVRTLVGTLQVSSPLVFGA